MASPVDSIKERLGIADVVGSYLKLEKAGSNLKAKCPFHNERTASFFVSPSRGGYYCFGCGAKGDIFTFVQEFEGLDFIGTLKMLAAKAGVELPRENKKERSERERLYDLLESATSFFEENLESNAEAKEYLYKRALSQKTISEWRIGFAKDEWRSAIDYLKTKGFTEGEIEKAGISKKSDDGRYYDRFRQRVMFPIADSSGRAVAFSGRILGKESEGVPKYLNSPETPLFSKSNILYGFDKAKQDIRRLEYAILVEGQMDLVMSHQAGFKNTVASSGTALSDHHLMLIKRLSDRIMMVYDADKAGIEASLRSGSLALSLGFDMKIASLPKGQDPAELIKDDPDKYKECLKSSKHVIDFYLDQILTANTDERKLGRAIKESLLPYVASLSSSIERSQFVSKIARLSNIKESAILEDLRSIQKKTVPSFKAERLEEGQSLTRRDYIEKLLFGLLFWQKGIGNPSIDLDAIENIMKENLGPERFTELSEGYKKNSDELVFQAEAYYSGHNDLLLEVKELLSNFEEDAVKDRLEKAMKALATSERLKDPVEAKKRLAECQKLSERLSEIRKARASP